MKYINTIYMLDEIFHYLVSYDDKEMTLNWHKDNPVTVSKSIQIPSYTLSEYRWFASVEEFTTGKNPKRN